jgi:hypothetical protein
MPQPDNPTIGVRTLRAALAQGLPAMTAARLAFEADARHWPALQLKNAVRDAIELGAWHPQCRARYGRRAEQIADRGLDLDGAVFALERAYRQERTRAEMAFAVWASREPRLSLLILDELRLLSRWLRRYQPARLPEILDALTTPAHSVRVQAAE